MESAEHILNIAKDLSMIAASLIWFWLWWSTLMRCKKLNDKLSSLQYDNEMLWKAITRLNTIESTFRDIYTERHM